MLICFKPKLPEDYTMKFRTPLLCSLLFLSSSIALASDEGLYLGVNAIYGSVDLEDTTVNGVTYSSSDDNTFGGGITFGVNTSKYFALDAAIDGLNKIEYEGEHAPTRNYWFAYLAAKPMLTIWKFNAFAEVGAAYVHVDQNNPGDAEDTSNSMIRPYGGAGIGINFTPSTELSISINRIQDTDNPITFGMLTLTHHFVTRYENSGFLAD